MLDKDIAEIYGVSTKRLNEQVKRNKKRFPREFMFQLTESDITNLRSQNATSSWGGRRYRPFVFTEYDALMLSSVLNSKNAIKISLLIIKAFSKLKQLLMLNNELLMKVKKLELRQNKSEEDIQMMIAAINMLLDPQENKENPKIGFI